MNMAVWDEQDWAREQAEDEANEKRALHEAYERIYRAVAELELIYNMGLPDLRADVRLTEMIIYRSK